MLLYSVTDITNRLWRQSARLYDSLGEQELLIGLISGTSTHFRTKEALDQEGAGNYLEAINIYMELKEEFEEKDLGNIYCHILVIINGFILDSKRDCEEKELWLERALISLQHLCRWDLMYDTVDGIVESHTNDLANNKEASTLDVFLSSKNPVHNSLKDRFCPYYVQSMLMFSEHEKSNIISSKLNELNEFISRISNLSSTSSATISPEAEMNEDTYSDSQESSAIVKQWFEKTLSSEMALGYLLQRNFARAQDMIAAGVSQFVEQWTSLHPHAIQARRKLLTRLPRLIIVEDGILTTCSKDNSKTKSFVFESATSKTIKEVRFNLLYCNRQSIPNFPLKLSRA